MFCDLPGHASPFGLRIERVKERMRVVGEDHPRRGVIEQGRQALVIAQAKRDSIFPLVVVLFLDVGRIDVEKGTWVIVGAQNRCKVTAVNSRVAQAPLQCLKQVKRRMIGNRLHTTRTRQPAMMDRANKGVERTSEHVAPAYSSFERVKFLSMIGVIVILIVYGPAVR